MFVSSIELKGIRVNNLKNISLQIPRNKLVVITGLSGSGKSSLAFDTLYAEGQRRYVESLSSYARQFMGRMKKPDCDYIKGIPPAIAIEQKVTNRNRRSTVGTCTEVYDYLRMLYARVGKTISPISGKEVKNNTIEDVIEFISTQTKDLRYTVLSKLQVKNDRSIKEQLEIELKQGVTRVDINGDIFKIEDLLEDEPNKYSSSEIYLVIDRLKVSDDKEVISRLADAVETAFYEGDGICNIRLYPDKTLYTFSNAFEMDGIIFEKPSDAMFSFNSPAGACPECEGFGQIIGIDESLVIPNSSLSVYDGAVQCWRGEKMGLWKDEFCRRAAAKDFPIFEPYFNLTEKQKDLLWHGDEAEEQLPEEERVSIDAFFRMLMRNQYKIQYRVMLSHYRGKTTCPVCHGKRLKKTTEYVKIAGKSITELVCMQIEQLNDFFQHLELGKHEGKIAQRLLKEIRTRLQVLVEIGLGYLTLNRPANTLSGGESQRISIATSLGSSLVGSLYILDEPSIGLHSCDTMRLLHVLEELRDLGNTVIVVEHDEDIIRAADYIIDIGPGAGRHGGEIVYQGNMTDLPKGTNSHTLRYLLGEEQITLPSSRRAWNKYIELKGCRANNLKGIDVKFPLNVMTVVTGVSGSGKSTLVGNILYRAIKRNLDQVCDRPGEFASLTGNLSDIKVIEFIDQNSIGKSTRSNPVTYIKAYDSIRNLMASQQLAKQMGFTSTHFSFNIDGGRCERCSGEGIIKVPMQFMADLEIECEECHGKRFKKDILDIRFHDMNINDILEMTVNQAINFFETYNQKDIVRKLKPLQDVGLGYIKLNQSSSTLSGGENQRVKLASFLASERLNPTLFIFDEPTTGLHFHDINVLLKVFNSLIQRGHTLVIIEHNMEIIKSADYIIDLGPEGGNNGGHIVCTGTPEQIAKCKNSQTGKFLNKKTF
ncbi:MAG: excinuclease ABC subunit UvrA [Prevotellaceae bacterium]|nr:excinuclease ABC subunit UvrA [Candidatus Faecinaster equi]